MAPSGRIHEGNRLSPAALWQLSKPPRLLHQRGYVPRDELHGNSNELAFHRHTVDKFVRVAMVKGYIIVAAGFIFLRLRRIAVDSSYVEAVHRPGRRYEASDHALYMCRKGTESTRVDWMTVRTKHWLRNAEPGHVCSEIMGGFDHLMML